MQVSQLFRFIMKTKYLLLYVIVGIAFAGACLWVFLSRGKNAKALRAKYRLGGIMLSCLAVLSVASCGGVGGFPEVTCYEPVSVGPGRTEDIITVRIDGKDKTYQYNELSPGDVFHVEISRPTSSKYVLRVILNDTAGTDLQRETLTVEDADKAVFDIPLSDKVKYRGEAIVQVQRVENANPEELSEMAFGIQVIKIR